MKLTKEQVLKLPLVLNKADIHRHNFVRYKDGTVSSIYETTPIPLPDDYLGIKTECAENNTKNGDYVVLHNVPYAMRDSFSVGDVCKIQDVGIDGGSSTLDSEIGEYTLNNWSKLVMLDGVELNKRFVNNYKGLRCDS